MPEMDIAWESLVLKEKAFLPHSREMVDIPEKDEPSLPGWGGWKKVLPNIGPFKRLKDPRTKFLMDAYKRYDKQSEEKDARFDDLFGQTYGGLRTEVPARPDVRFGPRKVAQQKLRPTNFPNRETEIPIGYPLRDDPGDDPKSVDVHYEPLPRPFYGATNSWWNLLTSRRGGGRDIGDLEQAVLDKKNRGETLSDSEMNTYSRFLHGSPPRAMHTAARRAGYVPKGEKERKIKEAHERNKEVLASIEEQVAAYEAAGGEVGEETATTSTEDGDKARHVRDTPGGLTVTSSAATNNYGRFGAGLHAQPAQRVADKKTGISRTYRTHLHSNYGDDPLPELPDSNTMTIDEFRDHLFPSAGEEGNKARTYFLGHVQPNLNAMTEDEMHKWMTAHSEWENKPKKWVFKPQSAMPDPTGISHIAEGGSEDNPSPPTIANLSEDEPIDLAWAIIKNVYPYEDKRAWPGKPPPPAGTPPTPKPLPVRRVCPDCGETAPPERRGRADGSHEMVCPRCKLVVG